MKNFIQASIKVHRINEYTLLKQRILEYWQPVSSAAAAITQINMMWMTDYTSIILFYRILPEPLLVFEMNLRSTIYYRDIIYVLQFKIN